jgi:uncharacterized protein (TIGR03382 family)
VAGILVGVARNRAGTPQARYLNFDLGIPFTGGAPMFKRHVAGWLMAIGTMALAGCGGDDRVERFISDTAPTNLRDPDTAAAASLFSDPRGLVFQGYFPAYWALGLYGADSGGCLRLTDASDAEAGVADWRLEGSCTIALDGLTYRYDGVIIARGSGNTTEIHYRDVSLAMSRAAVCNGLEEVTTADGVVRAPFLLLPPRDGVPGSEPVVVADESWFEIRGLFSTKRTDYEACTVKTIEAAYDLSGTYHREFTPDDPYSPENDVYTVEGAAAVRSGPIEPQYGLTAPDGSWTIAADDYAFAAGEWCEGPVGGALRLAAGGDVVVIHGDAALSCGDWDLCAPWSLNGVDQPDKLCNISWRSSVGCSAGSEAPLPWVALALLIGALLWDRRRRLRA